MDTASSRERLNRLLDLASRGPGAAATLLDELADLLLDWPIDYAQAMRGPFEALLEKTAREADAPARARLLTRIAGRPELPLSLCNTFFLDAEAEARMRILERNAALDGDEPACRVDACGLVTAARKTMNGAFVPLFASALSLPGDLAARILADRHALAIAAKGAGLDRAAYSALALLTGADAASLGVYDEIPERGAAGLMRFWRANQ
ncbi:MAG: hypothetical protein JO261_00570 [Alphaproteobacteria bacterium]|nr:hypothetical protein [Alphaproteobacteria bacterium]MBV9692168.1 hypothetical protein [Alphaproteobacteria bacterium]